MWIPCGSHWIPGLPPHVVGLSISRATSGSTNDVPGDWTPLDCAIAHLVFTMKGCVTTCRAMQHLKTLRDLLMNVSREIKKVKKYK